MPETGFLRIKEVLKLIPVGRSIWWKGVKDGRFPKPVKLGPRTTAWRAEDIRQLIENPNLDLAQGERTRKEHQQDKGGSHD